MKSGDGDIVVVSTDEDIVSTNEKDPKDYTELTEVEHNLWDQLGCPDFISEYIVKFGVNSNLFNEECTTEHNPNWSEFIELLIFEFGFNIEIERLSIRF